MKNENKLFAAAPDLLEAAKMAERVVLWAITKGGENSGNGDMVLNTLRAAIAKAEAR